MRKISIWLLKLLGWTPITIITEPTKSVICVAPHTSNWDFLLGKLYYWSVNRQASFLMKKGWFFFPVGNVLRKMGGVPVDRSKRTSVTDQMVKEFNNREIFHLAITPEGTRSFTKKWKMGFYHIAVKANVPIQLAFFDYKKKEMGITGIINPTGNEKEDLKIIWNFYKNFTARFPEKFYNHALLDNESN